MTNMFGGASRVVDQAKAAATQQQPVAAAGATPAAAQAAAEAAAAAAPAPSLSSPDVQRASQNYVANMAQSYGRAATILTGGQGDTSTPTIQKKSLLGG